MWTQIKELFHDANFNPQLDTHLLQGYVLPTYKMPDPGFLGYVMAESSLVRTVKDMKHIKTEVCRKLPSGTNARLDRHPQSKDEDKSCTEAARGSARAETLGRGGGPQTPGSAPGAAGGGAEKRKEGRVQGFKLPKEQGGSPGPRAWGARQGRAVTCARGGVACGPPAVARRRPTAIFVRGATARAEPETFVYRSGRTRRRQGVARRHPASWSPVRG